MKKIIVMLLISTSMLAQKADISSNKVKWTIDRPEYLKAIKTFSYEIQDDGEYWNYKPNPEHYPEDTYPDLASLTNGIFIEGLESVDENADLKIIVGFLGNQLKMDNGIIRLDGTVNLMVIVQGNKLLSPLTRDVQLSVVVNPKKYPLDTPTHRNQTKARILTAYVQDFIDEHHYLFSEKPEVNIPFGVFKKTNKGIAETFNITSKIYIERILNSATDISILDEAITYWKSQIEIDFGKKMKDKIKDKVIYVNLTSASILKNDMDNAKKYHESVKKNSGFFDTWTIDYDKFFQRSEHINDLKGHSLPSMAITPNVIYLIAINRGGVYMYNNKQTEFSRIEIERFVPTVQSGISSLDRYGKPRIFIYKEDGSLIIHNGGKQNQIITSSGEEITFKESKGVFRPYVKQKNGNLSIFYGL